MGLFILGNGDSWITFTDWEHHPKPRSIEEVERSRNKKLKQLEQGPTSR